MCSYWSISKHYWSLVSKNCTAERSTESRGPTFQWEDPAIANLTHRILEALGILKQDEIEEPGQDSTSTASATHCSGPALPASPPIPPTPFPMLSNAGKLHQETHRHETRRNPTAWDLIPPTIATPPAAERKEEKAVPEIRDATSYFPSSSHQYINYSLLAAPAGHN